MKLRIGFDGKRAVQNRTGLGNYSRYVLEVLADYASYNTYVLFAPRKKENTRLNKILSTHFISFVFPRTFLSKLLSSVWRLTWITSDLKKEKLNIYHGLSNELPLGIHRTGIKSIVTIHDLIFLRYPQYYAPIDRFIYKLKFRYACRKADKILAISECTKRDIVSFFHIPEEKIRVVYQGCHPAFKTEISSDKKHAVIEKYALPPRFLLYVGSIEPRKNLQLIVKALEMVSSEIELVAIGKKTPYQEEVEKYASEKGLESRLHIFNNVPFEDLPAFYATAQLFIYPSFFEGFGIPIVEALSQGVPVIASTGSCLEEAGGPKSIYINPEDETELAIQIERVLKDSKLREEMSVSGKEYAKRFSDENVARELIDTYTSLL